MATAESRAGDKMPIGFNQWIMYNETCLPAPPDTRCAVRACVHPKRADGLCYQHLHFFDYDLSMTDNYLDPSDCFDSENPWRPILCVMTKEEISRVEPIVKVVYRGWHSGDVKANLQTGEGWRLAIAAAQAQQATTMTIVGKDGIARERPVNYAVGRGVGSKGHGRRRNLKCSQRERKKEKLKNKVGTKHGAHDDMKRWNRDSLLITGKWDGHSLGIGGGE